MKNQLTLEKIKEKSPCESGWRTLLKSFGKTKADSTKVSIKHLLESNGINDTLWVIFNCVPDDLDKKRNMLCDFAENAVNHAERVLPIFEKDAPLDDRPRIAIEKAKESIKLNRAAWAAGDAARAAARAAWAAWAAGAAARAAWAAWAAAGDAAQNQERELQKEIIIKYFGGE